MLSKSQNFFHRDTPKFYRYLILYLGVHDALDVKLDVLHVNSLKMKQLNSQKKNLISACQKASHGHFHE